MSPTPAAVPFEDFYAAVHPGLVRALARLGGRSDAEDLAQEALARTWVHWERVGPTDSPEGYVFTVARNLSRRRRGTDRPLEEASRTSDPADRIEAIATALLLADALTTLSRQQLAILLLIDAAGHTTDEVAERLGIAPSTVRVHLARGRARLRARLGQELQ